MHATSDSRLLKLFDEVVTCPFRCDGIVNNPQQGIIPRSFFCATVPSKVSLLIVGRNPAHAKEWEYQLYAKTPPSDLVSKHLSVVADLFSEKQSVQSTFHTNLIRRVAAILDVPPTPDEVFQHSALTALTKCQSLGKRTDATPSSTIAICAERFLLREIELYRPHFLLALGNEVFFFLKSPKFKAKHGLPVGNLWHPSWSNMPDGEQHYFETKISDLRAQYMQSTNTA